MYHSSQAPLILSQASKEVHLRWSIRISSVIAHIRSWKAQSSHHAFPLRNGSKKKEWVHHGVVLPLTPLWNSWKQIVDCVYISTESTFLPQFFLKKQQYAYTGRIHARGKLVLRTTGLMCRLITNLISRLSASWYVDLAFTVAVEGWPKHTCPLPFDNTSFWRNEPV